MVGRQANRAPSTVLRTVPLPRLASLLGGGAGSRRRAPHPQSGGGGPCEAWWRGRTIATLLAIALPLPAIADVVSKGPEAVAITIYRDRPASAADLRGEGWDDNRGLALVSETREVDLPAGRTRIDFQGVADAIIPASARLDGMPGVVERNFDYDLLDPGSLIEKSVGAEVMLRRTNPKTGQVSLEPATLRSGPDGVVVVTRDGGVEALGCGAGPEALAFDHMPQGLADKPTLSALADVPRAGHYKLTLSYLAVRIDWSADYVARLSPDGQSLDLTGWLTLSNRGSTSFGDAPTEVVAGHLNRLPPDLPNIEPKRVYPECWPMGTTTGGLTAREEALRSDIATGAAWPANEPKSAMLGAVAQKEAVVTFARRVAVTDLGEYKLYTLAEPTTVAANQTKQIRFLHQPKVKFETLYVWKAAAEEDVESAGPAAATAVLSLINKDANGLGQPLPAGKVSVRQGQAVADGRELFLGEPAMRDVPLNEPFELEVGKASDIEVRERTVSETALGSGAHRVARLAMEYELTNAKSAPVTLEVRQSRDAPGYRVVAESQAHFVKNGQDVWRVALPANAAVTLAYTVERNE